MQLINRFGFFKNYNLNIYKILPFLNLNGEVISDNSDVKYQNSDVIGGYLVGNVTLTYEDHPVYTVKNTIIIPKGSSLTIGPNVTIQFLSNTGIRVFGSLAMQSTEENMIKFSQVTPGYLYWFGIKCYWFG